MGRAFFVVQKGVRMAVAMGYLGELLSPARAAVELGVARSRIYQLLDGGDLHCVRTEIGLLIPRASVVAYQERREEKAATGR